MLGETNSVEMSSWQVFAQYVEIGVLVLIVAAVFVIWFKLLQRLKTSVRIFKKLD